MTEAAAALRAAGGDAHAITLDVTDPATARAAAKQVEERFGHLDILINNCLLYTSDACLLYTSPSPRDRS